MSGFGFQKGKGGRSDDKPAEPQTAPRPLDTDGLPSGPVINDRALEREAMQRAEALGFTDRGQGRGVMRRHRQAQPMATLYIKGPEDIVEWFIDYTARRGHRAYWNSLEDFRAMIERENASTGAG